MFTEPFTLRKARAEEVTPITEMSRRLSRDMKSDSEDPGLLAGGSMKRQMVWRWGSSQD